MILAEMLRRGEIEQPRCLEMRDRVEDFEGLIMTETYEPAAGFSEREASALARGLGVTSFRPLSPLDRILRYSEESAGGLLGRRRRAVRLLSGGGRVQESVEEVLEGGVWVTTRHDRSLASGLPIPAPVPDFRIEGDGSLSFRSTTEVQSINVSFSFGIEEPSDPGIAEAWGD